MTRPVAEKAVSSPRAREATWCEGDDAVHKNVVDACGILMPVLRPRAVVDSGRIEDDNVSEVVFTQDAPLRDVEYRRRQRRAPPDGFFQFHHVPVAHDTPQ